MDLLERFPRAWCNTCEKVRPIHSRRDEGERKERPRCGGHRLRGMQVDPRDAACSQRRPEWRAYQKAAKASEMAAQEIDRLIDPSAPDEERQRRKRRLLKGPEEFCDVRDGNRPKLK